MPNGDESFGPGNPAGFIRGLISEGENVTSGYDIFHEAGGHMQESRWQQLYANVADTFAREPDALALDPFSVPGPGNYGEWATQHPGMFASQVEMQVFDRDLGTWLTMPATYMTDEPHTPAEAEQWAVDNFDPANTGADYNQIVSGAVTVHLWRTVPLEG